MIDFAAGKEFLVAVQRQYDLGATVEWNGLAGLIIEQISSLDYWEVWAFRGYPTEGLSLRPRFYYRCERLIPEVLEVGGESPHDSETEVRG